MPPLSPQQRFGRRLAGAIDDANMTRAEFAIALGLAVKNAPYSPSYVTGWVDGSKPMKNVQVFAAERILDLAPGTLSQRLGFLPVGAEPVCEVVEAIERDPDLDPQARAALMQAYRDAAERVRRQRERQAAMRKKHRR